MRFLRVLGDVLRVEIFEFLYAGSYAQGSVKSETSAQEVNDSLMDPEFQEPLVILG